MNNQPPSPSLLKMAGLSIVLIIPFIYLMIAMSTGDLLWASPVFDERPEAIVVHCYGTDVAVRPGTAQFEALNQLVNDKLTGRKRWDPLTMSDVTYQEYQASPDMMVLELFFGTNVRVHSRYKFFSNVRNLIIPLEGRHANTNAIFGRTVNISTAGSFHVESMADLKEYLATQDICP